MLGIVLGAEEASVRTLWLQVTEMQLRVSQAKLQLESFELGEPSGMSGSRAYRCHQDLVFSISKLSSYLDLLSGKPSFFTTASGTPGVLPVCQLSQQKLKAGFHWPMSEPIT